MPSKPPIAYIEVRVFAHATEDQIKVETAVRNLLPQDLADQVIFQKTELTGHHGNSITLLCAMLEDKKLLPSTLQKIGEGLPSLDKETLCRDLKLHLERGNLYLRLDKQSAFLGAPKFAQTDPIHLKIHFKNRPPNEIEDFCRSFGLLL